MQAPSQQVKIDDRDAERENNHVGRVGRAPQVGAALLVAASTRPVVEAVGGVPGRGDRADPAEAKAPERRVRAGRPEQGRPARWHANPEPEARGPSSRCCQDW